MLDFRRRAGERRARKEDRAEDLQERLAMVLDPTSPSAEAYRTLRTNLMYALVDAPPKTLVLTSPGSREGKSTTCANLGVALAQANKKVLLLDCDLRKPVVHKTFGVRNLGGLVNVLVKEVELQEVWREPLPNLNVVPAGPPPLNPSELLSSKTFAELLARVRREFDYVLMDAPPVAAVSDATVLATHADGVLLVFDAQRTRKVALRRTVSRLETVGARMLGTIMNNVDDSRDGYYGYTYGSYA
jgi:capsular exopolysaccharide synthesis family protein